MSIHYSNATAEEQEEATRGRAEDWRYDPYMERAAELKVNNSEEFNELSTDTRIAFAYYENDKAAAIHVGRDVSAVFADGR